MQSKKKRFEKEYFSGYYRKNVGHFDTLDLQKSINWFFGWFLFLQKYVDFKKGKKRSVLEIGCSIGGAASILADRDFTVSASDISQFAIKRANELARITKREIDFYSFDVQRKIPLQKQFDVIYAFEVIEHLENPLKAIKNMKVKLKKGGTLICSTPNGDHDFSSDPTHISVKSPKEWKQIFKEAGFKKITLQQITFLPYFYKFNKHFHIIFPFPIYSKFFNSPLFIVVRNLT